MSLADEVKKQRAERLERDASNKKAQCLSALFASFSAYLDAHPDDAHGAAYLGWAHAELGLAEPTAPALPSEA